MSVRAKFDVTSVAKTKYGHGVVKLQPVTDGSEENKQFWQYTPSGSIELNINNQSALDSFEVGKEYYVDFTPVSKEDSK